jgi:hypothetical protein
MAVDSKRTKTTFDLEDEINNCIEGLSVNLTQNNTFKYIHDERLPDMVNAEVEKFRLALVTVSEFAMKHSINGQTFLRTNHEGIDPNDRMTTRVGFHLVLSVSKDYEEK